MYTMQQLHLFSCLFLFSTNFVSSIFSVHSSTSLSTNFSLHLQFLQSKYLPISQDLSHSHSQLLRFQINPLSHTPLSTNSLHLHLHLPSVQRCLLLQTLRSNLHLHLQVLCHSICLVSFVLDIRLKTLTFTFLIVLGTHNFAQRSLILLQLPLHLLVLIL